MGHGDLTSCDAIKSGMDSARIILNKIKPKDIDKPDYEYDILKNISQGLKEAKLIAAGKKKGKPLKKVISELRESR